jgi:hypothetical protein
MPISTAPRGNHTATAETKKEPAPGEPSDEIGQLPERASSGRSDSQAAASTPAK